MDLNLDAVGARHPSARAGSPSALRALSLSVGAGEQVAVIGPSGAGKTTLLHVAAAALPPQHGQVRLAGVDPWRVGARERRRLRARLFLAPQVPPLPPRQRVVTSVLAGRLPAMSLAASLRSLFYPLHIDAAHEALARFDLSEKLFDRVDRLSGGERQRVGLARALLAPASLWLIDEPLSALDPTRAQQAIATLTQLARERGHTLVATLHDVPMALANFPRIVALRGGVLAFDLPAAQVTPLHLQQLYEQEHSSDRGDAVPESIVPGDDAAPQQVRPMLPYCR